MSRVFITGSTDGIGLAAAKLLTDQGHKVTLHARNADRAAQAQQACPQAEQVLIGDLSSLEQTRSLAAQANAHGPYDSVIHNAGLGPSNKDSKTADGLASTFQVNTLAPYLLTALMHKPARLLYLSSQLHSGGDDTLHDLAWTSPARPWNSMQAYSDSKLHAIMLANAAARRFPQTQSCALDPGWIATKMGGAGAPGQTSTPARAIAEFAAGRSEVVGSRTGVYFTTRGEGRAHKGAGSEEKQEALLKRCEEMSGVAW